MASTEYAFISEDCFTSFHITEEPEQNLSRRFRSLIFFGTDERKYIFQKSIFLLLLFMILIIINGVFSEAYSSTDVTRVVGVVPFDELTDSVSLTGCKDTHRGENVPVLPGARTLKNRIEEDVS